MQTANIQIQIKDRKLSEQSRHEIKTAIEAQKDGFYEVHFLQSKYRKSRYKYYFGYLLPRLIRYCFAMITEKSTGEMRHPSTSEVHEILKCHYNGVIVQNPLNNEISIIGGTTTEIGDYDFIELYEGQIIAEFSERFPMFAFDLENNNMFMDRELWTHTQKEKYNQMKKLV